MGRLKEVSDLFAADEGTHPAVYTEEICTNILQELKIEQYENISSVPRNLASQIFTRVREGKVLEPEEEQLVLDFFQEILVDGKIEEMIMAKALRYLLRNNRRPKTSLVVVDVQNDFITGSLALQEGSEVVPVINEMLDIYCFDLVFYSMDWHPEDHCSYITNVSKYKVHESSPVTAQEAKQFDKVVYDEGKVLEQVMWPVHCLQGSEGAQLHDDLKLHDTAIQIYKGQLPNVDSYSAFWDNGKLSRSTMLSYIFDGDITHIFTCGLATDFCVGMTSLDAAEHGFHTYVVDDACRGVAEDSCCEMKKKMVEAGCEIICSTDIQEKMNSIFKGYEEGDLAFDRRSQMTEEPVGKRVQGSRGGSRFCQIL